MTVYEYNLTMARLLLFKIQMYGCHKTVNG